MRTWNKDVGSNVADEALNELVPGWRDMELIDVHNILVEQQTRLAKFIQEMEEASAS